jgi:tetratricopeptide (TPR) repeat protein
LAYRTRDQNPNCSVFWVAATNVENVQQAYLDIGRLLQVPRLEEDKVDVKRLVQDRLSQESAGQWLLILDNADDVDMWFEKADGSGESRRLFDYLPRSSKGSIIITTRSRKVAVKMASKDVIEVPEMDEDTATGVLNNALIGSRGLENHQTTVKLLTQLTFLPLAIVQAAAYINENGISISDYLSLFDDTEENIIMVLSEEFEDEGRYRDGKNPVATTWLISFEQIRRRDPLAAEYLCFMSCLDSKRIPQSLLPPAQSKKGGLDAIGTLTAYAFITRRPEDRSFDLHRLVHLATRNWLREEDLFAQWSGKVLARLADIFPDDDYRNREVWRAYLPHARYVLQCDVRGEDIEERLSLLDNYGRCLLSDGRYTEAEQPFVQAVEIRKKVLGQEHPNTLIGIANLASTFWNQGRWKEAEELVVQVMETRKRELGQEHPETLTSMNNLAFTWKSQCRNNEALELMEKCFQLRKRKLGRDHPNTMSSLEALGEWLRQKPD